MNRKQFISRLGSIGVATVAAPIIGTSPLDAAISSANVNVLSSDKKIRVGIIGCGSVSGMYLPHLTKCPYAEVVSLCDIIPQRAQDAAKKYNVKNWYPHIDKMLAGVPFDLFVNLTDMQEHGRLNRMALKRKINVWSEKPMANT